MKTLISLLLLPILTFAQSNIAVERWSAPVEIKIIMEYFPTGVNKPYISSSGTELYFEASGKIYFIEKTDSVWSPPILINQISGENIGNPKISPDNTKLFFTKQESFKKKIFYVERADENHSWSEIKDCGGNINNDSTIIEDYVVQNNSTLLIRSGFNMYSSVYEWATKLWCPLQKNPDFYYEFYFGSSGGTFINSTYSKVYHTSLYMELIVIDDRLYDFLKNNLVVRYKDWQDHFGEENYLNINTDIDSLYGNKIPQMNYFALSPSITKNGKTLFFAVNYADTTRIYYSNMLIDENGNDISSVEGNTTNLPADFVLYQNYPNPFNPSTTIEYTIPNVETRHGASLQHVTLIVYDILGREIIKLVDEYKQAGTYSVQLLTNNLQLSSGVYFYRLQVGSFSETKKFTLLK